MRKNKVGSRVPRTEAPPSASGSDWIRLPKDGETFCGLTRSFLARLCQQRNIRSVVIRQPGRDRGVRLIYKPSLDAFLLAEMVKQETADASAEQIPDARE